MFVPVNGRCDRLGPAQTLALALLVIALRHGAALANRNGRAQRPPERALPALQPNSSTLTPAQAEHLLVNYFHIARESTPARSSRGPTHTRESEKATPVAAFP